MSKRAAAAAGSGIGAVLRMARAEREITIHKKFSQNAGRGQTVLARIWQGRGVLRERREMGKRAVAAAGSGIGAVLRMARAEREITIHKKFSQNTGRGQTVLARIWQRHCVLRERREMGKRAAAAAGNGIGTVLRKARAGQQTLLPCEIPAGLYGCC